MANNMTINSPVAGISAETVLLMHFDDNGSWVDATGRHTFSMTGSIQNQTSVKKFGTRAMYYSGGSTHHLSSAASADWSLNTGDWTIDFWALPDTTPNEWHMVGTANPWFGQGNNGGAGGFGIRFSSGAISIVGNGGVLHSVSHTWQYGNFHHYAFSRVGSTVRIAYDGTIIYSAAAGTFPNDILSTLYIFGNPDHSSEAQAKGYLDELRIVKNEGFTANFTPPFVAYTP